MLVLNTCIGNTFSNTFLEQEYIRASVLAGFLTAISWLGSILADW